MLVDTGADYTLFPYSLAQDFGIQLPYESRSIISRGVGGNQKVYFLKRKLRIWIGTRELNIPVGFIDRDDLPPLLGREGCLNKFSLHFINNITTFE